MNKLPGGPQEARAEDADDKRSRAKGQRQLNGDVAVGRPCKHYSFRNPEGEGDTLSLLGPNQEDQRKIHAQINQILNQRFLLTTLAITLFGVIASWLIPKAPPSSHQPIGGAAYALAMVHSAITFALFLLQVLLRNTLHLYTTYLVVTKASNWEQDWTTLRKNRPYTAYSKPIAIVFALLNVLIVIFPFTLAVVYDLGLSPLGMWLLITVGVVFQVLIIGLGFRGWFDNEQRIHDQWVAIQTEP